MFALLSAFGSFSLLASLTCPPSADCFPGGIHWLSIGQLEKTDLLVKIQSLCFRLEQSLDSQSLHRPPNSLDEAKERLRFLMLRRYPRLLYVQIHMICFVLFRGFLLLFKFKITKKEQSMILL